MGIPIMLVIIICLFLILNLFATYIEGKNKKKVDDFLKEAEFNNFVPKKKLDEIKFINVNFDSIKFNSNDKDTNLKYNKLCELSKSKMTNFGSKVSNFNLKQTYGANNFNDVLSYQENYDNFLKLIVEVSENLYKENNFETASKLLEIGVNLNTDITKNYTILADIYNKENDNKKLFSLMDKVLESENISKQKIINHISNIKTK